jgi:surface antigen
MEIKTWQKVVFFGSIAAFVIYVKRHTIGGAIGGALSKLETVQRLMANYAVKWVGTEEVGNNNGFANDMFESMMKQVGWRSSDQWCMYFAKMIHYNSFPNDRDNINKVLNGLSQGSFANATNDATNTYMTTKVNPQVGDIIIFQHLNLPATGHAGVVVKVNNNNTVDTIEGNTSDKNISDGDLVARKTRTSVVGKSIGGDLVLRGFIRKKNLLT